MAFADQHVLDTIREGVISNLLIEQEKEQLKTCRPFSSCRSYLCPSCTRISGYQQKDRIFAAAQSAPDRKWKRVTLKAQNVALNCLRDAGQQLMQGGRDTMKALGRADYALRLETSVKPDWSELYHPHLHLLVDMPTSGRSRTSEAELEEAYLYQLAPWLQPAADPVHVDGSLSVEQWSYYISKSPYGQPGDIPGLAALPMIVDGIRAWKGLKKFTLHGIFAQ